MPLANVKQTSPYSKTEVTNEHIRYLDIWKPIPIPVSANDSEVVIESKYHKRPDKMAFDLYGSPNLWWVFAVRNKDVLEDPIEDFTSGKTIFTPAASSIKDII